MLAVLRIRGRGVFAIEITRPDAIERMVSSLDDQGFTFVVVTGMEEATATVECIFPGCERPIATEEGRCGSDDPDGFMAALDRTVMSAFIRASHLARIVQ